MPLRWKAEDRLRSPSSVVCGCGWSVGSEPLSEVCARAGSYICSASRTVYALGCICLWIVRRFGAAFRARVRTTVPGNPQAGEGRGPTAYRYTTGPDRAQSTDRSIYVRSDYAYCTKYRAAQPQGTRARGQHATALSRCDGPTPYARTRRGAIQYSVYIVGIPSQYSK